MGHVVSLYLTLKKKKTLPNIYKIFLFTFSPAGTVAPQRYAVFLGVCSLRLSLMTENTEHALL